MKQLGFILTPLALLAAVVAYAQVSVQTRSGDGGVLWFDINSHAILPGHIVSTGQPPVLTACGGGSPAVVGSDLAGTVTVGTTATGCVITFSKAFSVAPSCIVGWATAPLAAMSWSTTTAALTVVQTSASSNVINYICFGKQ